MKLILRLASLAAAVALLAAVPAAATDAAVYGSSTTYAGAGKHPKTAVSGLIIDGRTQGPLFVCFDYNVFTDDNVKGQITAVAERISGNKVDKIANFGKTKVQPFDFSQIPPGGGDQCAPDPDDLPDFNIGTAADCVEATTPLAAGDIVRFTFKFKKGSKLKGRDALMQVFGSVLPLGAFPGGSAAAERVLRGAVGPSAAGLPGRSHR